ncbi:MAG: hypothetical protein OES13_11025 [Acidimicrobiia bacterium]|nr:hypothetical protein [Acidimicrobiia bacterium]
MKHPPSQGDLSSRLGTDHALLGHARLRRVGRWRFPVYELVSDDGVVALLGRMGWLRIFLRRGVRVELNDGARWRIRATTIAGFICPLIVDTAGGKIAVASGGTGVYRISGRDFGYSLNPGHHRWRASARWTLRHHETDVGVVGRRPLVFDASEPVHIGAVLLSFVLIRYGVPDDARPGLPTFRWR